MFTKSPSFISSQEGHQNLTLHFSLDLPFNLDDSNLELNDVNQNDIPDNVLADLMENISENNPEKHSEIQLPVADSLESTKPSRLKFLMKKMFMKLFLIQMPKLPKKQKNGKQCTER